MVLDLDSLIIKLREEMKFWTSISLTVREEIKNSRKDSREPYYTSVRTSYIETALGQRRLEEMLLKNGTHSRLLHKPG